MAFSAGTYIARRGGKISNESLALVDNLYKLHQAEGTQPDSAAQYGRFFAQFLSWVESQGHALNSIPSTAVEDFLSTEMAEKAPASRDAARGFIRAAVNRVTAELGVDLSHLHIGQVEHTRALISGVRASKKDRVTAAVQRKLEERAVNAVEMTNKGARVRNVITQVPAPQVEGPDFAFEEPEPQAAAAPAAEPAPIPTPEPESTPEPEYVPEAPKEEPMSDTSQLAPIQPVATALPSTQFVVLQQPARPGRPPAAQVAPGATTGAVQFAVNGVQFRGPFVAIYRQMDGSIPGTMPGTEVLVDQAVSAQIKNYGTPDSYLQKVTLPRLQKQSAIPPGTPVVTFVLVELNATRTPTNTRAEITVGVPLDGANTFTAANGTTVVMPQFPEAPNMPPMMPQQPSFEAKMGQLLLERLAHDTDESRKREERALAEAAKTKDAHMQEQALAAQQREQDLRKQMESMMAEIRAQQNRTMLPPLPPPSPESNVAEILRAQADSQRELMVALSGNRSEPAPALDPMASMQPILTMMQAQAQAAAQQAQQTMQMFVQMQQAQAAQAAQQAAENQKLMMQMQQQQQAAQAESTKLVITLLTTEKKESDFDKLVKTMMMKKFTDDEGSIDKLAKNAMALRQASEALGMGGGGGSGLLDSLVNNLPGILSATAKMQQAAAVNKQISGASTTRAPAPTAPAAMRTAPTAPTAPKTEEIAKPAGQTGGGAPNPLAPVNDELRTATAALLSAAMQDGDDRVGFINALQNFVTTLVMHGDPKHADALLAEFTRATCYEEVFNVAKYALLFGGIVATTDDKRAVAACLHSEYTAIYALLKNGEVKVLDDADDDEDEGEDGEEGEEGAGGDDDAVDTEAVNA